MSLEAFRARVAGVASARELAGCIRTHVLEPHLPWSADLDADALAGTLWDLREAAGHARSFVELGTGHGFRFFVTHEFLRAVNPAIQGATVDETNRVVTDVLPYVAPHRTIARLDDVPPCTFDIVLVDSALHRARGIEHMKASLCVVFWDSEGHRTVHI
jgi:hypothetical protein